MLVDGGNNINVTVPTFHAYSTEDPALAWDFYVKHYKDDEGNEHIDTDQVGTGGLKGSREARTLNWIERAVNSPVFGAIGEFGTLPFRVCC